MTLRLRRLRGRSPELMPNRRGLSGSSQSSTTAQPTYGGRLSTRPIFYYDVYLRARSLERRAGAGCPEADLGRGPERGFFPKRELYGDLGVNDP